jgi:mannosylglycoprotein endo-beta-mannosidase
MMNCATGQWPIKYLGVSVSGTRLHVKDWLFLDEKLLKRLDGWQGASQSYGGRLTLINACLSSIPTYAMSMYMLPKTMIKKIDRIRKRFFLARWKYQKEITSSQMDGDNKAQKEKGVWE